MLFCGYVPVINYLAAATGKIWLDFMQSVGTIFGMSIVSAWNIKIVVYQTWVLSINFVRNMKQSLANIKECTRKLIEPWLFIQWSEQDSSEVGGLIHWNVFLQHVIEESLSHTHLCLLNLVCLPNRKRLLQLSFRIPSDQQMSFEKFLKLFSYLSNCIMKLQRCVYMCRQIYKTSWSK